MLAIGAKSGAALSVKRCGLLDVGCGLGFSKASQFKLAKARLRISQEIHIIVPL